MNLGAVFATGLFTGGLTCLAVQGGLLAALLAQQNFKSSKAVPIISFLLAKLVSYTVLGALLGYFGSFFQLSLTFQIIMQVAVGIFMVGTALNLLDIHPIFRYFVIQPPKFFMKLIRNETSSKSIFAPVLLGAFTILIPCGTTQAMMALAIGSGSPFLGAAIMFLFILGTSPIFFTLGFLATKLGDILESVFMKFAAVAILLLSIFNLNAALTLTGTNLTPYNVFTDIKCTVLSICGGSKVFAEEAKVKGVGIEEASIELNNSGYSPKELTVHSGSKVTLTLNNKNASGCIQAFTIPKLNIQKIIRTGETEKVEFTAPDKPQDLAYMCGMGMYRGNIRVI